MVVVAFARKENHFLFLCLRPIQNKKTRITFKNTYFNNELVGCLIAHPIEMSFALIN